MSFLEEVFPPVLIELKVGASEAIAKLREVNGELKTMEARALKAGGSLDLMTKGSKYAGAALLGLGGAAVTVGMLSVHAYEKILKSQANLQVAIKNTGVAWKTASPYVEEHANKMLSLGFTYEDTYAGLSKMTAATGSPAKALMSLSAVADIARFKQISLLDASNLLARASVGQARGLGDLGLAIGKTIPKGASFEQILKIVESRVHGASDAFKKTLPGAIAVTRAEFQRIEVQIGEALLPAIEKTAIWVREKLLPAFSDFVKFLLDHKGLIETIAISLAAVWAVPKVEAAISAIGAMAAAYGLLATSASAAAVAETAAGAAGFTAADRAVLDTIAGSGAAAAARRAAAGTAAKTVATGVGVEGAAAAAGGSMGAAATAAILLPIALLLGKAVYDKVKADQMTKDLEAMQKLDLTGKPAVMGPAPAKATSKPWYDIIGKAKDWTRGGVSDVYTPPKPSNTTSKVAAAAKESGELPSTLAGKGITTYDTPKVKKPSIAQLKRQKAGGTPVQVNNNLHLDGSVISKSVTHAATHGTPLKAAKKK
jgi:hypothetical protein